MEKSHNAFGATRIAPRIPWLALAVLVLGCLMAGFGATAWDRHASTETAEHFEAQAESLRLQVEAELVRYEDALRTIGQFHGQRPTDPFSHQVVLLDVYERFPAIRSLRFIDAGADEKPGSTEGHLFLWSRSTGAASVTPESAGEGSDGDIVVIQPIYLDATQARFSGFVRARIDPGAMLADLFSYRSGSLALSFTDDTAPDGAAPTGVWPSDERTAQDQGLDLQSTTDARAFGRQWQIAVWSRAEFEQHNEGLSPLFVFAATLILSLLASLLVWSLTWSRARAIKAVDAATADLQIRERELAHQATHDTLTGLSNRRLLADHLELGLARAQRTGESLALLFIDLDRFKEVNDTYGHDIGDAVLKEVGDRLTEAVRPSDTVSRLGGDEFVVLCEEIGSRSEADHVAERIATRMAEPMIIGDVVLVVTGSIGMALHAGGGRIDAEHLLQRADHAMYAAKQRNATSVKPVSALRTATRLAQTPA